MIERDLNPPEESMQLEPEFERDYEAVDEIKFYYVPDTTLKGLFEAIDTLNRVGDELLEKITPQALEKKDEQR